MDKEPISNFSKFVTNYKQLIRNDNNSPEIYKWECVSQFQNYFNIDAPDFERMLRVSLKKVINLIYVNSLGFLLRAAKHFPEEVREMFKNLYNENKDLQVRIEAFQKQAKDLLPSVIEKHGKALNHQQDERTISFYMSMKYPDKYPLFKDDIYNLLIDVFPNEKPQKAGRKYSHFIELSKKVIPIIEDDKELLKLSGSTLTENSYSGNQIQLIFQDILWRNRPQKDVAEKVNYYLLGAFWGGEEDKTREFVGNGIWENGYADKFREETKSIKPGSRVAIKAVHTEAKAKSVMTIKAIGTVTHNHNNGKLLDVEWDSDFTPFKVDFSGGYWGTVHHLENTNHINAIFFRSENRILTNTIDMTPHNIILYGPPGTGKTYNSIDKAVEIVLGKPLEDHIANKLEFDRLRREGQVEFVTFHQSYSYDDFVVGIAPDIRSNTLRFDKKEGIFKILCEKAKKNWMASANPNQPSIDFDQVFKSFFRKIIEEEVEFVEIPMKSKGYSFKVTLVDLDDGRIKFTKKSGGTGHDLLVKNLKGIYEGTLDYGNEGLGVYYYPLVEKLREYATQINSTVSKNIELKNYVLIIDEINRANISKVFGELITLLEDDKRLGQPNELMITLPNGEKEFGIPPNLYLIGTMNTADKSIALVDIALRRRFEFIGYYPDYELPELDASKVELLKQINSNIYGKKKSADYLIGHAYFLNNSPIEIVLRNKVIPLLMEYFSGKTDVVCELFTGSKWLVNYNTNRYDWDIQQSKGN